jgi:ATP-dependent DNA ligase
LCGVFPDGITSFSMIQATSDVGNAAGLVYFIFDLPHLDGEDLKISARGACVNAKRRSPPC